MVPLCDVKSISFSVRPSELSTSTFAETHKMKKVAGIASDTSLLVNGDRRQSLMIGDYEKEKIQKQKHDQRRRRRRRIGCRGVYCPCCSPCCCLCVGLTLALLLSGLAALLFLLLSSNTMITTKKSMNLSLSIIFVIFLSK